MSIGERIKELRLKKGWKQKDLAEASSISRVSIGNYERGTRIPTTDVATKIALALDVPVGVLLGEDSDMIFSKLIELNEGLENGFSLNYNPLQDYEQEFLKAVIKYMQANKDRENNIFMKLQEQLNKDKD